MERGAIRGDYECSNVASHCLDDLRDFSDAENAKMPVCRSRLCTCSVYLLRKRLRKGRQVKAYKIARYAT